MLNPLVLGVTLLTFSLTKALPGDPVLNMVGERAQPEVIEKIRKERGADKYVLSQYFGYIRLLIKGEFGRSYYTNRKVFNDLLLKFPNTLKLALGAMIIAIPVGLLLGFISAYKKDTILDSLISSISVSGLSVPVFWSGLLIMLFFSLELKINFIHIFKNALIPLITVIGLDFGSYLNGAVLTETIFGWDGIGRFTMEGIIKRDYPVIMGCIIVGTTIFVIINLIIDILYHSLDPRVRLYGKNR